MTQRWLLLGVPLALGVGGWLISRRGGVGGAGVQGTFSIEGVSPVVLAQEEMVYPSAIVISGVAFTSATVTFTGSVTNNGNQAGRVTVSMIVQPNFATDQAPAITLAPGQSAAISLSATVLATDAPGNITAVVRAVNSDTGTLLDSMGSSVLGIGEGTFGVALTGTFGI